MNPDLKQEWHELTRIQFVKMSEICVEVFLSVSIQVHPWFNCVFQVEGGI